jgi:hypothetical protein
MVEKNERATRQRHHPDVGQLPDVLFVELANGVYYVQAYIQGRPDNTYDAWSLACSLVPSPPQQEHHQIFAAWMALRLAHASCVASSASGWHNDFVQEDVETKGQGDDEQLAHDDNHAADNTPHRVPHRSKIDLLKEHILAPHIFASSSLKISLESRTQVYD